MPGMGEIVKVVGEKAVIGVEEDLNKFAIDGVYVE